MTNTIKVDNPAFLITNLEGLDYRPQLADVRVLLIPVNKTE